MSMILNEKYLKKENSYKLFITNRLLRLLPTYWVMVLATIVFSIIVQQLTNHKNEGILSPYFHYFKDLNLKTSIYVIFTNLFLFFQDWAYFLSLDMHSGNMYFAMHFHQSVPIIFDFLLIPPAWSIGLELNYYLIAPFIVKRPIYVIITLMLISFTIRVVLIKYGYSHDPWNHRFFPSEIFFFLLGNISYRIYLYIKDRLDKYAHSPRILKCIFFFIVSFTVLYELIIRNSVPGYIQWLYFFVFFCSLPFIFIYTKNSKIDRYIGELSYPIYISHWLMIELCRDLGIKKEPFFTVSVISLTIIVSLIINKLLNDKIDKYRQKRVASTQSVHAQPVNG